MTVFDNPSFPVYSDYIQKVIPHRFPFIFVDCITEMSDTHAKGFKNVTINEPFFQGHFPQMSVLPGVIIIETAAQIACFQQTLKKGIDTEKSLGVFVGMDKVRFKKPVIPGQRLDFVLDLLWQRDLPQAKSSLGKCLVKASVEEVVVCIAELKLALTDKENILSSI